MDECDSVHISYVVEENQKIVLILIHVLKTGKIELGGKLGPEVVL